MNKYLTERLETAHLDPKIENLVFIAAEALRGECGPSDAFNEFMNEELAGTMARYERGELVDKILKEDEKEFQESLEKAKQQEHKK